MSIHQAVTKLDEAIAIIDSTEVHNKTIILEALHDAKFKLAREDISDAMALNDNEKRLIDNNKLIEAIREYRIRTKAILYTAKRLVEEYHFSNR